MQTLSMSNHTQNVFSQMAENATQSMIPYVGMPVTKNYFTDRRAATVISIKGNAITVQENDVQVIDYYEGKYVVLPKLIGGNQVFTKRKNGRWVALGQPQKTGLGLSLDIHDHWIDPNF